MLDELIKILEEKKPEQEVNVNIEGFLKISNTDALVLVLSVFVLAIYSRIESFFESKPFAMKKPVLSSEAPVTEKLISFALSIAVVAPLLAGLFVFFCFTFLGLEFDYVGKVITLGVSLVICFFSWVGTYVRF